MTPFRRETGVVAPLPRANVDTDQIIPKQFLKRIGRTGYGPALFFDWRYQPDGTTERDDFVLNQTQYRNASILVGGANFGCGSSREHAVWALQDYGFRAVLAPSFADIFRGNATKMGLLPVVLPDEILTAIATQATEKAGVTATVDLEAQTVVCGSVVVGFAIDDFERRCLLDGLDDIALTLAHKAAIGRFEATRPAWVPDLRRAASSTAPNSRSSATPNAASSHPVGPQ